MRIHYIQPYATDRNIGAAINSAILDLAASPDDWIVLTDHDILWLLPDSKAHVEAILSTTGYDILGCMTNRVRSREQLVGGVFSEDDRIRSHITVARECWQNAGGMVKDCKGGVVAGFMLCFQVWLWSSAGQFLEDSIVFDRKFCESARSVCNAKIGIMQGIYVFHLYRMWSSKGKNECSHLIQKT